MAVRLLTLLNPIENSRNPEMADRYRGEPYAVAADVYSSPDHLGQAGWTWYSGSAGWMYRVWLEDVLGFRLTGNTLHLTPAIPAEWDGFEIRYRYRSTVYEISARRGTSGESGIELDGHPLLDESIPLTDDGAVHTIIVWLPR
jgi:cellobiose phosphorylase